MSKVGDDRNKQGHVCMLVRTSVLRNPRVVKQAASLVRAGWRVTVVSAGMPGESALYERHPDGFEIRRTRQGWLGRWRRRRQEKRRAGAGQGGSAPAPYRPGRSRLMMVLLRRFMILLRMLPLLRRARPDIVLAHNVNTLLTGWLGARLCGARLVYDAHEVNLDREGYYQKLRGLIRVIEGCVMPRCDLTITTTAMRARHFRRVYGLKDAPLVFANFPRRVVAEAGDRLREQLGLGPEAVIALYQGGLQEGRGLHNMVRAVARVPGVELVFMGGGAQQASLAALADELGVARRVHFPGAVPLEELAAYTASADIGLQLLRNTCFNHYSTDSNKLFEYALSGLPVIASDFPEIRRYVRRHDFGLLVNPHDVDAIAGALSHLASDAGLRRRLAANARAAAPSLTWEAVEDDYVGQLARLL
ncbi:glycosyltransferase [Natronospira bacteriovora]|uniref:Glycosyltransferase n=1 Tax=Natronospira bacteriovora TaxID=3069753 RepID=A0ABU0WB06_9GAMM|nr:glycosyltransferase [Natronospira sp. AB-CW4]MDQ2070125.1 glycosyltransferase [Natronospira sp. AB-CW4]